MRAVFIGLINVLHSIRAGESDVLIAEYVYGLRVAVQAIEPSQFARVVTLLAAISSLWDTASAPLAMWGDINTQDEGGNGSTVDYGGRR